MSAPPPGPGRGQPVAQPGAAAPRGRAALLNLARRSAAAAAAATKAGGPGPSGDVGATASTPPAIPVPSPVAKPPATNTPPPQAEAVSAPAAIGRGRAMLLAKLAKTKPPEKATEPSKQAPPVGPLVSKLQGLKVERPASPSPSFATAKSDILGSKSPSPPAGPGKIPSRTITPIPKAVSPTAHPSRPITPAAPPVKPAGVPATSSPTHPDQPQLYRGTGGKPLRVTANYIRLDVQPGHGVFEHEVLFEPRVDSRDERFKLVNQQESVLGRVKSFDGAKLYLPIAIEGGRKEVTSVDTQTGQDVKLTIIYKREREQGDRDLIYLYNNLINKIMRTLKLVQHNRNFFDPKAAHKIPAYNLDVWPGYATAVDRYEGGLLLQLDAANRVIRTETVRDLLMSINKKMGTGGSLKQEAEKQLLGVSVLTRYNNKSYIVDDIDFSSSPKATFTNEKGQELSFMQYYQNNYGIKIRDENQPLLIHRPRKKASNEKDVDKIICLVPELCLLTGLTEAMRADFKAMKEVGNFTRLSPARRQEVLHEFIKTISNTPAAKAHLKDWGLRPSTTTVPLEARQLAPEVLHFGRGYKETVTPKADWGRTATSKHVLTARALQKWAVVFLSKNQPIVKNFCQILQQQGPRMGINVAGPKVVGLANDRTETYLKAVREIVDPSTQLVVTIFPQMRSDRYAAIKKLCTVEKPVASQAINLKTISNEKKVQSVVQKIALQINCKLGGELWGCATPHKNLMVVGIDVYHDKSRKAGSVAGVVASINDTMSRYYSKAVLHEAGQEILDTLKVAFVDCLIKYWEVNHEWPRHIVVFRDGVGDGQLEIAEKHEAEQFIRAFTQIKGTNGGPKSSKLEGMLPPNYNPGFTYVVVQKRINTRIYSCVPRGAKMEFENPPPGTVLDHTVTRYKYKDFFLVPQSVNQGTVSPTHFIVVRELGTEPDARLNGAPVPTMEAGDVQKLAYKLTHMYFNWPGTVRVPSPVQYAHKLVDLVGQYVHKEPSPQLNDKLYYL